MTPKKHYTAPDDVIDTCIRCASHGYVLVTEEDCEIITVERCPHCTGIGHILANTVQPPNQS